MLEILTAEDLWKSYCGKEVVCGVSLSLRAGEILGILGPNGAGKTTIVGMLYGYVRAERGEVNINGINVRTNPRAARNGIGVVTQENNLDRDFNVRESLLFFAHHYRMGRKAAEQRVDSIMKRVGLEQFADLSTEALSGGFQRRFVLARALINEPKIIFLDEPTTGLDPEARQDFWRLVSDLRDQGAAILLTTHYMDEAERLCDRLLLIGGGKIINQGTPRELIDKIAGEQILECTGLSNEQLAALVARFSVWHRPFGQGVIMNLVKGRESEIWDAVDKLAPHRLTKRRGDLQDVFLYLTGVRLEH